MIKQNPFHRLKKSRYGQEIIECAENTAIGNLCPIQDPICELFISCDILSQAERESLFCKMHVLRSNTALRDEVISFLPHTISKMGKYGFYQCLIQELVGCLLELYRADITSNLSSPVERLNVSEQGVLYYIAGYIIHKVKSKKFSNLDVMQACVEDHPHEVDSQFKAWTNKMDRGGLQYPAKDFFDFILQSDMIADKVCGPRLSIQALRRDHIIENIMDSPSCKLSWDKICANAGVDLERSLRTMEYVISSLLSVKGHAIARREQFKLRAASNKTKSLRHTLRDFSGSQLWNWRDSTKWPWWLIIESLSGG